MKLDTELVREVLAIVEELPFDGAFHDIAVAGRTDDEITYHIMLKPSDKRHFKLGQRDE